MTDNEIFKGILNIVPEIFKEKPLPFNCPLTGELIEDATMEEVTILDFLKSAKEGEEVAIKKLYEDFGLTKENVEGIKSLKGLRYFKEG